MWWHRMHCRFCHPHLTLQSGTMGRCTQQIWPRLLIWVVRPVEVLVTSVVCSNGACPIVFDIPTFRTIVSVHACVLLLTGLRFQT